MMKSKLLAVVVFVFLQFNGYGSEIDSDSESVSSKSSNELSVSAQSHQSSEDNDRTVTDSSSLSSSADDSSDDDSDDSGTVQDKVIDKTWGLKNLLYAIPNHDLQRSPLLGLIAVCNGTIKKWYGEFTDVVVEQEEGRPARNKRNFVTNTSLEKVTRVFFDVLDGRVRCSAAGSSPMIALSAKGIGQLVTLTQERGVSGVSAFLEKGLVRKQKQKKESLQQEKKQSNGQQISAEELFVNRWWASYETRPEKGKFTEERDFRKRLIPLFKDLRALEQEQGSEKTKQIFLTVLMAFLVLKDEAEGEKDPVYAVQEYFRKLGVVFTREYYTLQEKKAIKKRLARSSFGTSTKDLEDAAFYLFSIAKNDFEFITASHVSALFKEIIEGEERNVAHALCAEVAVRSFVNLMLYNPVTQRFDAAMLPEGVHLDPLVYDFYFNREHPRTDPQAPQYYATSLDAWIQVITELHKKFSEIKYEDHELKSSSEGILLVFNKIFGTTAQSYEELGNMLSHDGSHVTLEMLKSEKKPRREEEWAVAVEREGLPGESAYEFFATLNVSDGHASLIFDMGNIMPLMGKHRYQAIEELQKVYHLDLWPMVLNPATINTVIDDETPFQKAIETGCVPLVELLVSYGADIHQLDDGQMGILAYAYESGSAEMVKFFTDKGLELHADLNTIIGWLSISEMDDALFDKIMASNVTDTGQRRKDFYSSALMVCFERNMSAAHRNAIDQCEDNVWIARAKKLIAEGADVNFIEVLGVEGGYYNAPILAASYGGCTDDEIIMSLVNALEPAGDNKNRAMVYGKALCSFFDKKNISAAEVLIKKGANLNFYTSYESDGTTQVYGVVLSASYGDNKELMQIIVDELHQAPNEEVALMYGKALLSTISKNWFEIAVQLIKKGALLDQVDEFWLKHIVGLLKHDQAAEQLLQVIGTAQKSATWTQMYGEVLREYAGRYGETEEWLKRYGAVVEQEAYDVVQAVERDAEAFA